MNMIKNSNILKVINNFRKSITINVNIANVTSCLEELLFTLNNKRVLFPMKDVSKYLLHTLFMLKNVVEKNYFFNVQDGLNYNVCRLVSMAIDNILLMSLNNTADDYEIASQITMIIEHYVHGHENRLLVFCNSEHISDKLMAINHSNILNILDIRFPQCFTYLIQPSIINAITPNGNTSDDSIFSSDQFDFTTDNILTKGEKTDQQSPVHECNMSYDELMMFIYEPNSNEADIPWLNSLQIHAEYSMMFKKNMLTFQEHSNNCMENLDIFNSEPQIDTFFESIDSITEPKPIKRRQASKETKTKNLPKRRLTEEKSTVIIGWQSQVYCYKCHLVIENKQQYNCIQCNHSYHKICFMTNDLICLDCNISRRLKYYDPESLGLILNTTLKKVLNDKEASNCLARIRCPVNLYYISLKVETGKYKCIPDFIDDFNSMLHFCWINPKLSHLKSNAEKVLEKVLQELRKIAVVKK